MSNYKEINNDQSLEYHNIDALFCALNRKYSSIYIVNNSMLYFESFCNYKFGFVSIDRIKYPIKYIIVDETGNSAEFGKDYIFDRYEIGTDNIILFFTTGYGKIIEMHVSNVYIAKTACLSYPTYHIESETVLTRKLLEIGQTIFEITMVSLVRPKMSILLNGKVYCIVKLKDSYYIVYELEKLNKKMYLCDREDGVIDLITHLKAVLI